MAHDVNAFKAQFPEFGSVDNTLIQPMLDAAALQVPQFVWGTHWDQGIMWLAADMLVLSPSGQNARLVQKDGISTYRSHYNRLKKLLPIGASYT